MSDIKSRSEKKNFKTLLSIFLSKNRVFFLVLIVVILVLLAGTGIYTSVYQNKIEKSAVAAEELQKLFEEWSAAPEEEKAEKESQILRNAEDAIESFGSMYAAQRARMVLGGLYYEKEEWDAAVEEYDALADSFPRSYLAPIALMSAAVANEQAGRPDDAISAYQRVREAYSETFPDVAYALFSIGRLYEKTGKNDAALEAYNEVVDNFSASSWTNLAQDRIIYLEAVN